MNFAKMFKEKDIGSQRNLGMDAEIVLALNDPEGGSEWMITEADELADGDWLLYGYNHIHKWEWGYVRYSQICNDAVHDDSKTGKKVSDYVK